MCVYNIHSGTLDNCILMGINQSASEEEIDGIVKQFRHESRERESFSNSRFKNRLAFVPTVMVTSGKLRLQASVHR